MLNCAVLMGRLVADPELRHTQSDISVTSFTIAIERSYVKAGEERQADFINIVAWRGTAEFVSKYFHKGQLIAIQGTIQTRSYTDKEGNKRKAFEVVADKVSFCGKENNGNNSPYSENKTQGKNTDGFEEINTDDDLPF